MNRRRFLAALAAIPFLRRFASKAITVPLTRIGIGRYAAPFPFAGDPRYYGGMTLKFGSNQTGTMTMEVSPDMKTWRQV